MSANNLSRPEWRIWTPTVDAPAGSDLFDHFRAWPKEIGLVVTDIEMVDIKPSVEGEPTINFSGVSSLGQLSFQGPYDPRLLDTYREILNSDSFFCNPSSKETLYEKLKLGKFLGTDIHYVGGEADNPIRPTLYLYTSLVK
ncbi:MAG: hypothetical protein Q7T41_04105 [Candidatus Saccharibacteria bacterium]|nr:hypothetical protein [Candidatus Saccharibacteria bacterium]